MLQVIVTNCIEQRNYARDMQEKAASALQVQLLIPVSGKKRPEMLREQIGWVGPNARGS